MEATQTGSGPFMLTLCRVTSPDVRPPQSPQLKSFKFFTSRARQSDGSERRYLHMGYFATLGDAQKWAQLMRGTYPSVIATAVPAAVLRQTNTGIPTLAPAAAAAATAEAAATASQTLTDTQVLSILEGRRVTPATTGPDEASAAQIALLRPEDSGTRRILKEAVARGAPVSFAVQLLWSVQPIDLASVPVLAIFKAYKLYAASGNRDGRTWYCLRLGFFSDAISAKQVASYMRSSFGSVAVVPVTESERSHAQEVRIDPKSSAASNSSPDPKSSPDPFQQQIDQALAADQAAQVAAAKTAPIPAPAAQAARTAAPERVAASIAPANRTPRPSGSSGDRPSPAAQSRQTLEQTLELIASSELWTK